MRKDTLFPSIPNRVAMIEMEELEEIIKLKEKIHEEKSMCSKLIDALKNTEHRVLNDEAVNKVTVMDDPGSGGACHRYLVTKDGMSLCFVKFQEGPVKEFGVTGCQNEDLLAIVIDRLECFQTGKYDCMENSMALDAAKEAMLWLNDRTKDRTERGVEGTNKK